MQFATHPGLDDLTLRYIVESRPLQDRLQQCLTQVAGFALLVMTRGQRVPMLDAPVAIADEAFRSARDGLRALRAPAAAMHHHHHVNEAAGAVERSLGLLVDCLRDRADEAGKTALVRCLKQATHHLGAATRALPGFEMVDFSQACCAAHAKAGAMACE